MILHVWSFPESNRFKTPCVSLWQGGLLSHPAESTRVSCLLGWQEAEPDPKQAVASWVLVPGNWTSGQGQQVAPENGPTAHRVGTSRLLPRDGVQDLPLGKKHRHHPLQPGLPGALLLGVRAATK